jgi:GWxTD domain-containing protein
MSRVLVKIILIVTIQVYYPVFGYSAGNQAGQLPACSPVPPYFCVDASYFFEGDSHIVEVYLQICNDGLQFVRTELGYEAGADVAVVLLDDKNRQVAGDTYRVKLNSAKYRETTSVESCKVRVLWFKAEPGDFKMSVTVRDRDSRTMSRLEAPIEVPRLADFPSVSDIEFLFGDDSTSRGRTPGFRPSVKRVYDARVEEIPFYYEVYHGSDTDSLVVIHEVLDSGGLKVLNWTVVSTGKGVVRHLEKLSVDSLSNERYTLRTGLQSRDGKSVISRSKEFQVESKTLYWGRNAERALALLAYIAKNSLIDSFAKADTLERKRIWEEFWREKDPTPTTPRNEFYEEHLRRFTYANEHFAVSMYEGWRSDRGRVYILYGEPDEIDSRPFEMGRNPTEVWYYFRQGKRFVFVDETGFGDYVLVSEDG